MYTAGRVSTHRERLKREGCVLERVCVPKVEGMVTVYWQWWNSRAWIGTATALSKHSNLSQRRTHTTRT